MMRGAGAVCGQGRSLGPPGPGSQAKIKAMRWCSLPPVGDGALDMVETKEQALIHQLIPHHAVETINVAAPHRLARDDVVSSGAIIL